MCNNSHHTLDMLLHYLVKYNNSKLTQITVHTKYNKMSSYLSLIFVDSGVKVNGSYYRDVLLSQKVTEAAARVP